MMVYLKMGWLIVIVIGLMKRIYVSIRFEKELLNVGSDEEWLV